MQDPRAFEPAYGGLFGFLVEQRWWIGVRGLCALTFGAIAILWPGATLEAIILLLGIYLIFDGIFAAVTAIFAARAGWSWIPLGLEALLNLAVAAFIVLEPKLTILFLIYLAGFWAVLSGGALLAASVYFGARAWPIALAAVSSIILGLLCLFSPLQAAVAIAIWLGIYALVFGASLAMLAWRLHRVARASGFT